ncbi:hypothetical protein N7508_004764 [Penicillium antarcticum]|uniref:uncharacterized protein n=1 Tax=Penicillium antarcticum TaxID=416450 RepID=UPI00238ADD07|nr:uncharacterized protein N7508_004764 [Penicillium antarcticum]KAJ5305749.1 hypothetical protein N7508_004764 [Penicillium antarcticum]
MVSTPAILAMTMQLRAPCFTGLVDAVTDEPAIFLSSLPEESPSVAQKFVPAFGGDGAEEQGAEEKKVVGAALGFYLENFRSTYSPHLPAPFLSPTPPNS